MDRRRIFTICRLVTDVERSGFDIELRLGGVDVVADSLEVSALSRIRKLCSNTS